MKSCLITALWILWFFVYPFLEEALIAPCLTTEINSKLCVRLPFLTHVVCILPLFWSSENITLTSFFKTSIERVPIVLWINYTPLMPAVKFPTVWLLPTLKPFVPMTSPLTFLLLKKVFMWEQRCGDGRVQSTWGKEVFVNFLNDLWHTVSGRWTIQVLHYCRYTGCIWLIL